MKENTLADRLFEFSVQVILFLRKLPNSEEMRVIKYQLTKAVTSGGANYEESQAASSRSDFLQKVRISLREMRESNYWLRIIQRIQPGPKTECNKLVNESEELKKILGSITSKIGKEKSI